MLKFLKRKPAQPPIHPQEAALERAYEICDLANATIPDLPRGFSLWMDWSTRPPQLTVVERGAAPERIYPPRRY